MMMFSPLVNFETLSHCSSRAPREAHEEPRQSSQWQALFLPPVRKSVASGSGSGPTYLPNRPDGAPEQIRLHGMPVGLVAPAAARGKERRLPLEARVAHLAVPLPDGIQRFEADGETYYFDPRRLPADQGMLLATIDAPMLARLPLRFEAQPTPAPRLGLGPRWPQPVRGVAESEPESGLPWDVEVRLRLQANQAHRAQIQIDSLKKDLLTPRDKLILAGFSLQRIVAVADIAPKGWLRRAFRRCPKQAMFVARLGRRWRRCGVSSRPLDALKYRVTSTYKPQHSSIDYGDICMTWSDDPAAPWWIDAGYRVQREPAIGLVAPEPGLFWAAFKAV